MYKNNFQTDYLCIICEKTFPRPDRCFRHIHKKHKHDERLEDAVTSCRQQSMFNPMKTFLAAPENKTPEILQIFHSFFGFSRPNWAFLTLKFIEKMP